ncbi:Neutral lipase [Operophtera brumata]|uniref:Neutral lipase n=1 Tax=Operophtera brumata TaxID=104452 RepID=A0A0L7KP87_OPEBR|nr:Neutral lipase [Operophtera brumata]
MFVKICVFASLVGYVFALERGDLEKYGPFRLMLNSPIIKCVQNRSLNLDVNETILYFYDFAMGFNKAFPIHNAAEGMLNLTNLDKSRQFIMYVGGFTSAIEKDIEEQMRNAYKTYPNSYFMIPDHSAYTYNKGGIGIKSYERSVTYVHFIGKALGQMLVGLKKGGVSPKKIHLVGHSLGGQILGHAGATFLNITGESIARITALDPAGPCFTTSSIEYQVRSGVAEHVDIYHCNSGALGSSSLLGDVDFVINKRGEVQPTCNTPIIPGLFDSSRAASCSHRYCIDVWTSTVKDSNIFPAYRCDSYDKIKTEECITYMTIAGSANPGTEKGVFYFSTEQSLDLDVSATYIYFYDFSRNLTEVYPITDSAKYILNIKNLDKKRKFVLFVAGFKSQIHKKTETQVREAYKTYYIGKALGEMLAELKNGGVSPKNIHCVGHSLGGQMLGHTGETFNNLTGEKIARITALDPAGPCFTKNFINEQVRSGVADYVEVYHCNSGGLGSSSILGDVDFIINRKGETQPNCGTPIIPGFFDSSKAATCAHRTCVDVWTASVKNNKLFTAYSCDSYKNFKDGKCSIEKTLAGAWNPGMVKGIYYLSTKDYDLKAIR